MYTLVQAVHNYWFLAPVFLVMLVAHMATGNQRTLPPLLFQPIQPQKTAQKKTRPVAPPRPPRHIPYKKIFWMSVLGILTISSGYFCVIRSVGMDWDPEDIAEIEIIQYPLNDVTTRPQKTISLKSGEDFQSVLQSIPTVEPATQPREYSLGRNYLVRVKRKSDGNWSKYRIQFVQDRETANSPKLKKVYLAFINYESSWIKLGDYDASALGNAVESIFNRPPPKNLALKAKYESSDPNRYGWGKNGLTDGSWNGTSSNCFATGDTDSFPKYVTVDLGSVQKINHVNFGVPKFGSTRTVQAAISKDGMTFTNIGSYKFSLRKEERTTLKFAITEARYIRLTYVDHYDEKADYSATFAFTTELEAYFIPQK